MISEAKKAILKLFQCYNLSGNDFEKSLKFEAYWEILSGLPPDAIVAVCRKASRGEVGQPGFLPTAGELFQAATPWVNGSRKYPLLPPSTSRVVPPDERARIKQGFAELRSERLANKGQQPGGWTSLGNASAKALREWKSIPLDDVPLPPLSAEMRAILGSGIPKGLVE